MSAYEDALNHFKALLDAQIARAERIRNAAPANANSPPPIPAAKAGPQTRVTLSPVKMDAALMHENAESADAESTPARKRANTERTPARRAER